MNEITAIAAHRPLFRNMVRREVRQRYKGSVLGLAWTLINPIIAVAAYAVVFRYLFRINIPNYAVFLFIGVAAWTFFYGGAQTAASSLVGNANLVKKVRFPREIVPLSVMTGNAFTALAMFAVAVPLALVVTKGSYWPLIVVPPLLVLFAAFTVGFGLMLSAMNVYWRDVEHILLAISLPWFFLTPIFYSYDTLPVLTTGGPTWIVDVLHWGNPVSPFIVSLHEAVFFGHWPDPADLIYCLVAAVVVLAAGWHVFKRLEREMAVEL